MTIIMMIMATIIIVVIITIAVAVVVVVVVIVIVIVMVIVIVIIIMIKILVAGPCRSSARTGSTRGRRTCIHICMYMCVCMYVCIYIYIYIYMFFTSQTFAFLPRSFCSDSSSPQISAILAGRFTLDNCSLRNLPRNFRNNFADKHQTPGSRNSLGGRVRARLRRGAALGRKNTCKHTYINQTQKRQHINNRLKQHTHTLNKTNNQPIV